MDNPSILLRIVLTIVFGAIIGLETETRSIEKEGASNAKKDEKFKIGGIRTYTLVTLMGGVAGLLYNTDAYILSYVLMISIVLLIVSAYILNVQFQKAFGLTTEIAVIISFVMGFLTTSNLLNIQVILVILVLMTFFLSQKRGISQLISRIKHVEVRDFMRLGLISLVILPILPNVSYSILDILKFFGYTLESNNVLLTTSLINPFQLWLVVVLISSIGLVSFLLKRFIGNKSGMLITGFLGGLVSSTSTTFSIAQSSKVDKNPYIYVSSAILSNASSFITLSLVVLVTSLTFFREVSLFLLVLFLSNVIVSYILFSITKKNIKSTDEFKYTPFSIIPAIKFVLLILFITSVVKILSLYNVDDSLLALITSLSGFTGVDAPSVAISSLVASNELGMSIAIIAFILTNVVNFLGKSITFLIYGNRKTAFYYILALIITTLISLVTFLI